MALLVGYSGTMLFGGVAHPRWVAMRVGFRDLTLWSFLMSTAHGAGLMLVPVLLHLSGGAAAYVAGHDHTAAAARVQYIIWAGVLIAAGVFAAW